MMSPKSDLYISKLYHIKTQKAIADIPVGYCVSLGKSDFGNFDFDFSAKLCRAGNTVDDSLVVENLAAGNGSFAAFLNSIDK